MSKSKDDNEEKSLEDNNVYLFMEEFTTETVKPVIEFILKKNFLSDEKRPDFLTLMICSPGGDVPSAFALIDIMNGSAIPIRTIGLGEISSCGIITFMSGAKGHRILTPNTSIMSHQWSWSASGKEHELFARQKEYEATKKRMHDIYSRCTGLTDKKIEKHLLPAHDVWLTAEEAVKYGIADGIKKV